MTLEAWLSERMQAAPPRLAERLRGALGPRLAEPHGDAARLCTEAAGALLGELLSRDSSGRDVALDLLTVDALATYAVEAAADDPGFLGAYAADAATRYARAAVTH